MGNEIPKIKIKSSRDLFKLKKEVLREFGQVGLDIFDAINGERTIEEIADAANVDVGIVEELLEMIKTRGFLEMATPGVSADQHLRAATPKPGAKPAVKQTEEVPSVGAAAEQATQLGSSAESLEETPTVKTAKEESASPEKVSVEQPTESLATSEESIKEKSSAPTAVEGTAAKKSSAAEAAIEKPPAAPQSAQEAVEEETPSAEQPTEEKPESEAKESSQEEVSLDILNLYPVINTDTLGEPGYVESRLFDKFGLKGIKVFSEINGLSTGQEIVSQTQLDEQTVARILAYLKELGVISLFQFPKQIVESETSFEPMEGSPDEIKTVPVCNMQGLKDILPVDLPIKLAKSALDGIRAKGAAALKFGPSAMKVFDAVDNKKDIIQLSISLNIPIKRLVDILAFYGEQKAIGFRPLSREEITERYGQDGLKIYKKFGRDGLLLYELLEKDMSIKDMIKFSGVDVKRGIEIIKFINELLGIDLPLDEEMLLQELGVSETKKG